MLAQPKAIRAQERPAMRTHSSLIGDIFVAAQEIL